MKKTQCDVVRNKLEKEGEISNFWAFQNYILRLGARIKNLRDNGMQIIGSYEMKKGKVTKNYIYRLVKNG